MFLNDPHRAGRYYATLRKIHEGKLFAEGDKPEPYYTAAYAAYRLEYLFRNNILDVKFKPVRWHALLAARALASESFAVPQFNSRAVVQLSRTINDLMWDPERAGHLFTHACTLVEAAFTSIGRTMDRDSARGQESTDAVIRWLAAQLQR